MPVRSRPATPAIGCPGWLLYIWLLFLVGVATPGLCMTDDEVSALRDDTRHLFWHGYNNYMAHAFPEDELKPLSCEPQTRNRENPADIGLNDVLGNYSVTLVDSLSTLAILASDEDERHAHEALSDFQTSVKTLVGLYGDGTERGKCGSRACGFDLDSKVQVFETNIRGVGGLLSAHLFAIGELPIRGYKPEWLEDKFGNKATDWNGFRYDGQLLRLAHDLASRLLPAFNTATGLPYPRVNLRHGIPFYQDAESGVCRLDGTSTDPREITETCAAGAGSLVLEFTTLSRLTGDTRFEDLAKRAFWAVWQRRSSVGLIGGGIDAESGQWTMPPLAGIGAGIDSFFEYALKSHVLLSGLSLPLNMSTASANDVEVHDPENFLLAWQAAHAAVKRHIYRPKMTEKHPYYAQSDVVTGAPRYTWIDNLSAFYPGLLALAGELEEAIESHLTYAALWTRYSALPERWMAHNSYIDPNFRHWAGRPEFIESTYYLYQATKDSWYLHVGEMTLRDIRRRCWTKCGWADLGDVLTGEQRDRMESFFLGETAKYLYLLFNERHPLNTQDRAVVFTTEGHPLVIPDKYRAGGSTRIPTRTQQAEKAVEAVVSAPTCPAPLPPLPLTVSNVANREDLFHAASLAQLHLVPINPARSAALMEAGSDTPGVSLADLRSPSNYTFYPWTLPENLIPAKGRSSPIRVPVVSTLTFPNLSPDASLTDQTKGLVPLGALQKTLEGVLVNSLSNLRLNMVQEPKSLLLPNGEGVMMEIAGEGQPEFRIHGIANWALGRDEKVLVSREALEGVSPADPHFTRRKDLEMVDLVLDVPVMDSVAGGSGIVRTADGEVLGKAVVGEWEVDVGLLEEGNGTMELLWNELESMFSGLLSPEDAHSIDHPALKRVDGATDQVPEATLTRHTIPAILPTGAGAAPLPPIFDSTPDTTTLPSGALPFKSIFYLDSTLCHNRLPSNIAKTYQILILNRGGCSFNDKLSNIPSFAPSDTALQLVLVLSVDESRSPEELAKAGGELIRPLLDEPQRTPNGFERRNPIAMAMVDGSPANIAALRGMAKGVGVFDGKGELVEEVQEFDMEHPRGGIGGGGGPGLAVKRRYWFESMGVPIGNLIVL